MALSKLAGQMRQLLSNFGRKSSFSESSLDEFLGEFRVSLLDADVALGVARDLEKAVRQEALAHDVFNNAQPANVLRQCIATQLQKFLGDKPATLLRPDTPSLQCIQLVGTPGSGKTTSAVKIARHFSESGMRTAVVSADFRRPGAQDQLSELAKEGGVPCLAAPDNLKAVQRLRDAASGYQVLLIDSPGANARQDSGHGDSLKIFTSLNPERCLLVLDALAGQTASATAEIFSSGLNLDGTVATRLDSDARGGAVLSLRALSGMPIFFTGIGERPTDLEVFHPDRMARRLIGEGDLESLLEQAQKIQNSTPRARNSQQKLLSGGAFTLDDLKEQFGQIKKLGGLASIAEKLPGGFPAQAATGRMGPDAIRRMTAAIDSMTPLERARPHVINPSRKKRICRGGGVLPKDINQLLKMHKQMGLMARKAKSGRLPPGLGDPAGMPPGLSPRG